MAVLAAVGRMNMRNRNMYNADCSRSTSRAFGYDRISRKCSEAYEVYFRGSMLCQSSRSDSLGVFRCKELLRHTADTTAGEQKTAYSTLPGPVIHCREQVGAAQTAADVTDCGPTEEKLRRFHAHAARTEWLASLGARSAALAHELTQPLTVVHLSLDDALDKLKAASSHMESAVSELAEALSQVPNIKSIVRGFRGLAASPSDKAVGEVDVCTVAERIVKLFRGSRRQMGIVLHLGESDSLPPVRINERDLEQLFFALIENAVHAAEGSQSRHLIVEGSLKGDYLELSFCDDCGGIPSEHLDKIFEPFFSTKSPDQGTGLGLCVVQEIVSRVGGSVKVESEYGRGTAFFVALPVGRTVALCRQAAASGGT